MKVKAGNKFRMYLFILIVIAIVSALTTPAHANTETTVRVIEYVGGEELLVREATFDRERLAMSYCADEVLKLCQEKPDYVCVYANSTDIAGKCGSEIKGNGLDARWSSDEFSEGWPDCWLYADESMDSDLVEIVFER